MSFLSTSHFQYLNLSLDKPLAATTAEAISTETRGSNSLFPLIYRNCSLSIVNLLFTVLLLSSCIGLLSNFSVCITETQELSMESGIDPGQDYYTQDYYNYDQGWAHRQLFLSLTLYCISSFSNPQKFFLAGHFFLYFFFLGGGGGSWFGDYL